MPTLIVLQWNNQLHGPKVIIVSEGLPSGLLYFVHEDWMYINRWGALCCSPRLPPSALFNRRGVHFACSKTGPQREPQAEMIQGLVALHAWPEPKHYCRCTDLGPRNQEDLSFFQSLNLMEAPLASPPAFIFCRGLTEHLKSIAP